MRQPSRKGFQAFIFPLAALLISVTAYSQGAIDWSKDTISRADANAGKLNYLNNIRGGGNPNATEQINLPVDKLKAVMDACAANNINSVSVFFIKIRQQDVAHYRTHNPGASDNDIKGSQMLVIKVPRSAFGGAAGAKAKIPAGNPLLLSLATVGIVQLDYPIGGLPFGTGDVYLTIGGICPPPASCGD